MAQANEQKNINFEDVWGKNASANIISGRVATALCLGFLGVCHNEKDSAHSLNRIMQAMSSHQLNEELLLLLEMCLRYCGLVSWKRKPFGIEK